MFDIRKENNNFESKKLISEGNTSCEMNFRKDDLFCENLKLNSANRICRLKSSNEFPTKQLENQKISRSKVKYTSHKACLLRSTQQAWYLALSISLCASLVQNTIHVIESSNYDC